MNVIFWIAVLFPVLIATYFFFRDKISASRELFDDNEYNYLMNRFPYFKRLSEKEQIEFALRVKGFVKEKKFHGNRLRVTKEMELLVAAYATQISFGLPRTILLHFEYIILHPKAYRSRSGRLHKGEVNPMKGTIHLSWPDLLQGLSNPTDGIDLGMHEMAHALWFEDEIFNSEMDFLPQDVKARWQNEARKYVRKMRAGKKNHLQKIW